jgi:enamine deaminase RidA (YjgF/YER057c/UK114 family)
MMSLLVAPSHAAAGTAPAGAAGKLVSLTLTLEPGEAISVLGQRLAAWCREHGAKPLQVLAFGQCAARAEFLQSLATFAGPAAWPVTWVDGAACGRQPIAGVQLHAFTGPVEAITLDGRGVASVFTDGGARQCVVGGLMSDANTSARGEQTRQTLEQLQAILKSAGFDLGDVVRTWFYLDDILSWYDEFNRARTKLYSGIKFCTGSLPASTGIGAKNPAGGALTLAAWAFRPQDENAYAEEVASPLQCPAPAYGSSFSRALETSTNGGRRLFISGSASIAPGGKTLHVGEARKQVELTMEVVGAMLQARGFTFRDLARATAYFRRPADAGVFAQWLADHQLTTMPVVSTRGDVCRDDLLFELEAEAQAATPMPERGSAHRR